MSIENSAAPTRRRARNPFFAFDSETGRRRPTWVIVLAGLLSVLLGIGGVGLAASAASAHNQAWEASCYSLTLSLTWYNNNGGDNTLSVKIDDVEQIPQGPGSIGENFGSDYVNTFTWDPATSHTFEIHAAGWDGYPLDVPKTTQAACDPPTVGLTATQCNTTGGTVDLTATASGFASYTSNTGGFPSYADTYTGTLLRDGVATPGVAPVTDVQSGPGTYTWTGLEAGHTYSWTVTSDQHGTLKATTQAIVVGCPDAKDFSVAVTQCTAPGASNAFVQVNATVVPGRAYTFTVTDGTQSYGSYTVGVGNTASAQSFPIPLAENLSDVYVVMTDDAAPAGDASKTKQSNTFSTNPCPLIPGTPLVDPDQCAVVGGTLQIHASFSGLVPGRAYDVLLNGTKIDSFTSSTSTWPETAGTKVDYTVTAGSYVVTLVDQAVPTIKADSASVTVKDCPTLPEVALDLDQCSVPGGTGAITASLTGLSTGRDYTVTLTDGGSSVPAYPAETITQGAADRVYSGLIAGHSYTVTVVDKAAPAVVGAASTTLEPCPQTPGVSVQLKCDIISGTSSIGTSLTGLAAGQTYTVSIVDDKGKAAAFPVDVTTASASAPTFTVPNGHYYTVSVVNAANAAIAASVSVYAAVCELETFPLDPQLPTLAFTGADTAGPMLGALGLVQFGVVLLALAAMLQFRPKRRDA